MERPLVTVVCLCFNHARFLKEALDSVIYQTYPNLEIILVDDFSTDNSRELIKNYVKQHPEITYLPNKKNLGVCASFNRAFAISHGKYLIDFATDDVLYPTRIAEQVATLEFLNPEYGVLFTDAELINEEGDHQGYFYKRHTDGSLNIPVPTEDVFAAVLRRHFISTPTMIMRREVYEKLNGYDASLAYEDFDFWVRSSREFKYYFLDKVLTKRRLHASQLSQQQYKPNDRQIFSTIQVCSKALELIRTETEREALIARLRFEFRQAILSRNPEAMQHLWAILEEMNAVSMQEKFLKMLSGLPLPFRQIRKLYYRFQYGK